MADAIIKDDFRLKSLEKAHEEALVRFLNDWLFYKNTLHNPYPYTHADA